jgi:hypothetical protein
MSCHDTAGGLLAHRLARAYSGLSEKPVQSLYHSLRREGTDLPAPTVEEILNWYKRQTILIKHSNLSEKDKERSAYDLLKAQEEEIDAATFYAWTRLEVRSRQEAVLRDLKKLDLTDLQEAGSESKNYSIGPDGRPTHVWYASYGSNLSSKRFQAYIKGGKPEGSSTTQEGCRNKTLPEKDIPIRFEGRMHFAGESTRWGGGGVAMMDNDHAGHALGRAYLITMEQFDDVVAQENGKLPGSLVVNTDEALVNGLTDIGSNLYGRLVHIGDYGNAPVFTFTGNFSAKEALEESKDKRGYGRKTNTPSSNYLRMISQGLKETFDMDQNQQVDYLRGMLGAEDISKQEMLKILNSETDRVPERYVAPPSTWGQASSGSSRATPRGDYDYFRYGGSYSQDEIDRDNLLNGSIDLDDPEMDRRIAEADAWSAENPSWIHDPRFGGSPSIKDRPASQEPVNRSPLPTKPTNKVFVKTCAICHKPNHTMHECPMLIGPIVTPKKEKVGGKNKEKETSNWWNS